MNLTDEDEPWWVFISDNYLYLIWVIISVLSLVNAYGLYKYCRAKQRPKTLDEVRKFKCYTRTFFFTEGWGGLHPHILPTQAKILLYLIPSPLQKIKEI